MPTLGDSPGIKKNAEENGYATYPKVESLAEGDVLNIVDISDEITKTPKGGYELMTLEDKDRGTMVTLATAIKNKLKVVLEDRKQGFTFGKDDPLVCTVTTYESHGRVCKALS